MNQEPHAVRKFIWVNILFFSITTLGGLIGAPLYFARYGISAVELSLFLFYTIVTGISITAGYHRLYSHSTYKGNALVRFFFLFFGAAAFEQTALDWSTQHRDHHLYVDTDRDPYSIKKGFWYAHIGWLVFWKHRLNYDNVKDLQKDRMLVHQHRHYLLWSLGSGVVLPVAIGALFGHALGAFLFAVCLRLTFVYHATFCINSVCHMFGKATYDVNATARDHWIVALITFGEGYHNFHHRFPSDYRNGVRWYHWDPSKWLISLLARIGWTWDLKRVSHFRILDARLAGEKSRAHDHLEALDEIPRQNAVEVLKGHYAGLRRKLIEWETASRDYQTLVREKVTQQSRELQAGAREKLQHAAEQFAQAHDHWANLIRLPAPDLRQTLLSHLA